MARESISTKHPHVPRSYGPQVQNVNGSLAKGESYYPKGLGSEAQLFETLAPEFVRNRT